MTVREQSTTLERVLLILNRATAADSKAISELIGKRVACNESLAQDPEIQVGTYHTEVGPYSIGLLGILSGIVGCHPSGFSRIAAQFSVLCPDHGRVEAKVGDLCPYEGCSHEVVLGELEGFIRTEELS